MKTQNQWLEISVAIRRWGENDEDDAACSAVTELFDRYGRGGAVVEARPEGRDRVSIEDPSEHPAVRIKMYLPAGRSSRQRREAVEHSLQKLRDRYPVSETEIRELTEEDWTEEWKKGYEIQKIGQRLVIVPSWKKYSPQPDEIMVTMDPGMAFGTGLHPTTRLCLIGLEKYLKPDDRVLDVGTGSGVLAIAAVKLGAGKVTGLDIEAAAVEVAKRNVIQNGVGDHVTLYAGTLREFAPKIQTPPLILVNILAYTIIEMLPDLKAKLLPGGYIISSGILKEYASDVEAALKKEGFEVVESLQEEDWVAIVARIPSHNLLVA